MHKRGLSHVITAVLLILLAIIAIIILWMYIRSSVTESSERTQLEYKCIVTNAEIKSCTWGGPLTLGTPPRDVYFTTGLVTFKQGEPTTLLVAFYSDTQSQIRYMEPINLFETKKILPPTGLTFMPIRAIVTPVVSNEQKTKNLTCTLSSEVICKKVDFIGNLCEIPTSIEDIDSFTWALTNAIKYNETFPDCPIINADFSCDGNVSNFDIGAFVYTLEKWVLCNRSMICTDRDGGDCWQDPSWCDTNCR